MHASATLHRQPRGPAPRGQRAVSFVLLSLSRLPATFPVCSVSWAIRPLCGRSRRTFSVNLDMVPDLTMRGQDDPHGRAVAERPPTIGQLAARVRDLAGRPGDWWHLVSFDPAGPVRVPLDDGDGVRVWLTTWPPGHRTDVHDHGGAQVSTVIAGELAEVTISADSVAERPLRANRVRVHGGVHTHALANPGPVYAISLHAGLPVR
jgi:hypothetical protein